MGKSCLDCLHCKVINKCKNLRCKAGGWTKLDGKERFITLIEQEIRTLNIRPRQIFSEASRCLDMVSMDD